MRQKRREKQEMTDLVKEVQDGLDALFFRDDASVGGASDRSHPFTHLEKAAVLQKARIFHDDKAVRESPGKCVTILAQLLRLRDVASLSGSTGGHGGGSDFTEAEATELFFGATKLFVSADASLRRMVYLFIKEIYQRVDPANVIIVTSSLTKDMTCEIDLYRANSLRVLCRIIDSSLLSAIERYVKQAMVDSSHQVSSAALVSASHLFRHDPECASVVRRWVGEASEAAKSKNPMVQFHALTLMCQIKSRDRLGVAKIVRQYGADDRARTKGRSPSSPLATVCLLRHAAKLVREEVADGRVAALPSSSDAVASASMRSASPSCAEAYGYLEACCRHENAAVSYEAARLVCGLPRTEPQDLKPAVDVLQIMLTSSRPAERYAAARTLCALSSRHPRAAAKCSDELEGLVADTNRAVGTVAITALLRTCSENNVDRLLKRISAFLTDIEDEHRIVVVKSLRRLCVTYPSRHRIIVGFLANFLREEGGFDFKRSIVDGVVSLMWQIPESTDSTLLQLCEFIEDCEYAELSTRILHLLGEVGPTTSAPARYIRFVYNRVILENNIVRAAAVSSLGLFGAKCPSLRPSVLALLRRSLQDEDDEVRDRAALAAALIERSMSSHPYVAHPPDLPADEVPPDVAAEDDPARIALVASMPFSFDKLERSIRAYASTPGAMEGKEPLTFQSLPMAEDVSEDLTGEDGGVEGGDAVVEEEEEEEEEADSGALHAVGRSKDGSGRNKRQLNASAADPASLVYAIPELAALGKIFRSSRPVPLTESETEYVVSCVKHIYDNGFVVLQFTIENTIEGIRVDDAVVSIESDSAVYDVTGEVAAKSIPFGKKASCFAVMHRVAEAALEVATFSCELRFKSVQVDPDTGDVVGSGPMEEEYPLEDLEVAPSDLMARVAVPDFRKAWESMGDSHEVLEKFALQYRSQEEAVRAVVDFLGMQPVDGTATIKASAAAVAAGGDRTKPHMLHLSGTFVGGRPVLVRAQIALAGNSGGGVVLKIAVRSEDEEVSRMVADCIR